MLTFQRGKFVGIAADLLAAVALTGVGIVFHMIVNKGSSMALVEVLALAVAVMAILRFHLWVLDTAGNDLNSVQTRLAALMRRSQAIDRSPQSNQSATNVNDSPDFQRNFCGLRSRPKSIA